MLKKTGHLITNCQVNCFLAQTNNTSNTGYLWFKSSLKFHFYKLGSRDYGIRFVPGTLVGARWQFTFSTKHLQGLTLLLQNDESFFLCIFIYEGTVNEIITLPDCHILCETSLALVFNISIYCIHHIFSLTQLETLR